MNQMFALINAMRNGRDPRQMLGQIARQNPLAAQALQIMDGKNPQELRMIVENMARERGTTFDEVVRQIGV